VFTRLFARASEVSEAMKARGYAAGGGRTEGHDLSVYLPVMTMKASDWLALLALAAVSLLFRKTPHMKFFLLITSKVIYITYADEGVGVSSLLIEAFAKTGSDWGFPQLTQKM
jgi:hypothetical protein